METTLRQIPLSYFQNGCRWKYAPATKDGTLNIGAGSKPIEGAYGGA